MIGLVALLLAAQSPPYVAFPAPGLDDPAAYEGYTTRLYRDSRGNTVQIYLDRASGRVVHLWADALNASLGFTARDTLEQPAALDWSAPEATAGTTGGRRTLAYRLTAHGALRLGHFVLGSMRVERDFQYAGRQRDSLGADFVVAELQRLVDTLARLPPAVRRAHVTLLGARNVAELRARLRPAVTLVRGTARWRLRAEQPSLDGRNTLALTIRGGARHRATLTNGVLTVTPRAGADTMILSVEIATDGRALAPLSREAIFNAAFRRFADSARTPRLEREIRGFELLSSRDKLMAGLPNFATYFGRDMLMTALLMEPVWADTMAEFVVAAALAKLAPSGEVSHEEALGGQAIRERAAEYLRSGDPKWLRDMQEPRENYMMVDDDFQLAVVAARYVADPDVPDARKRRFLDRQLERLLANLAYVARQADPYAREPVPANLVSFRRADDGGWHAGSWRDSRVGYALGRFAFDVNVVWVPAALRAMAVIDSAVRALGYTGVPQVRNGFQVAAAHAWRDVARHFAVALGPAEVEARVRAKLASLPDAERGHWEAVLARSGLPADTLRFPALALDSLGRPIPVMSTDPAMWLLLEDPGERRERELLAPFALPYPVGLLIEGVGPVAANDAYAPAEVWGLFERDRYHSPRVVWGREVNVLLAALARRDHAAAAAARDAVRAAVERSGLRQAELWSYRIDDAAAGPRPVRYGSSSDVQLWNLTSLAIQFLLQVTPP